MLSDCLKLKSWRSKGWRPRAIQKPWGAWLLLSGYALRRLESRLGLCVWQSILNKSQASRGEGRGGCHGNKEGLWLCVCAAAACWWCLKVGHYRHGISGLTPLKARNRELECEINAEAGCEHCHHFLSYSSLYCCSLLLTITFLAHSKFKEHKCTFLRAARTSSSSPETMTCLFWGGKSIH